MIDFLKNIYVILRTFFIDWLPIFSEMEKTAWGPLGEIRDIIGTILTIGAILIAAYKFWDKYLR